MIKKMILVLALMQALLLFTGTPLDGQADGSGSKLIAIVCSDSSNATDRSVKGIKQSLRRSDNSIKTAQLNLKADGPDEIARKIEQLGPDLVISVGSPSTLYIKENFPHIPLIFSTVLNPETSGIISSSTSREKITGASLDIPIDIQMQKFMMVYPQMKKIGVMYTEQTAKLIEDARHVAPELGLEIVAIKINSENEVPRALDSLCRVTDGIWTTADEQIYTPQATKFMILASLRNRKPIMGFSPSFVKSGALLGLNYDYKDIGRRAGELAVKFFQGTPLADLPIAKPGVIYLHINLKTADQLGIDIDQSLVDISQGVYK